MTKKQDINRLRRGILYSKSLVFLNILVIAIAIVIFILLVQNFFLILGQYEVVLAAFQLQLAASYYLAWGTILLIGIDILVTIFRHEYFHKQTLNLTTLRANEDEELSILVYHGITASINIGVIVGWLFYMTRGTSLFVGAGEINGSLYIAPLEYLTFFFINATFALLIGILAFYLITTRLLSARRFQADLNAIQNPPPQEIASSAETEDISRLEPKPLPGIAIVDEKRVPAATNFPPIYVPIGEQKRRRLEELRERHDHVFEEERERYEQMLRVKKQAIMDHQRQERDRALDRK